jgi:cyclomaltodextrinase / maltogenic alpha-amylase / neopullulanase
LQGDQFDGAMNYPFAEATLGFCGGPRVVAKLAEGKGYNPAYVLDGRGYAERMDWLTNLYPWEIQLTQMNLLDSHDTARAISLCGGDAASVRLATLLLMTYPGAPCLFAGDEIGQPGGMPDHDTRRPFPWHAPETWDQQVLAYHRALIALRREHKPLRRGTYRAIYADPAVYAFARQFNGVSMVVAVNVADVPVAVTLPVADLFVPRADLKVLYPTPDLFQWGILEEGNTETGKVLHGVIKLTLAPRSGVIIG